MTSNKTFKLEVDHGKQMKPFLSVDELIEKLANVPECPLCFTKEERQIAREFFKYTNYYDFSIYRKLLPKNPDHCYSFSDCLCLYDFNYFLRENLSRFTGRIELMLKASMVKSVCQNYKGALQVGECYLDVNLYQSKEAYKKTISVLEERITQTKSIPIKHHLELKDGKIPLWVLIDELTFGETTGLFSSFTQETRRQWVCDTFAESERINFKIHGEEFQSKIFSWFSAAWYIRNTCAHYSRLYGCNFTVGTPSFFSQDFRQIKLMGKKKTHNQDLFAYMLAFRNIIQFHTNNVCEDWNSFLVLLEQKMNKNKEIILKKKIGFTDNWMEVLRIK